MNTRRSFLSKSSLAFAASGGFAQLGVGSTLAADGGSGEGGASPQKIIHLVADGMSMGTLTCADYLSQQVRGRGLVWTQLLNQSGVVNALMNMRSLNSQVTDSSAASSSWGSGSRIANGAVNQLPDGRSLKTLYEVLGEAGWKRGLVTTTELTHATPAGFAASVAKRGMGEKIAEQYLQRGVDVLLGGGRKHFASSKRKDKKDLYAQYQKKGYTVMQNKSELEKADLDKPWVGTFSDSHLPYTVDYLNDAELQKTVPTLAEMAKRALQKLGRSSRFILQVEGGRVDHACHTCDAIGAFRDQIAFDEAVEECLAYQREHPDTLVVITTDHGNGNPGLNGAGPGYGQSPTLFAHLKEATASFSVMLKRMGKTPTTDQIRKVIVESTGYKVPKSKVEQLAPYFEKKGDPLYSLLNSVVAQMGQLMGNHWGIGWSANMHTADYVPLTAVGPGAARFSGFIQNTDVFHHYLAFAGIDFKNPTMPLMAENSSSHSLSPEAQEQVDDYQQVMV
ncbi:MAG: alkaline phosphatase [Verrucomicrobiales bacterium]|nr:alkaline phosphatase [Verrucomicrobiales bacterium]